MIDFCYCFWLYLWFFGSGYFTIFIQDLVRSVVWNQIIVVPIKKFYLSPILAPKIDSKKVQITISFFYLLKFKYFSRDILSGPSSIKHGQSRIETEVQFWYRYGCCFFSKTETFSFKFFSCFLLFSRNMSFSKLENKPRSSKIIWKYLRFGSKFGFKGLFVMEKCPIL